jgi:hypothetical protein
MYDLSLLYGPMYGTAGFGVAAVLTLPGTDGAVIELRAIDKTAGIVTGSSGGRFNAEVETISPAAAVRAGDIANIDKADLHGATLEMNGKTWTVENHAFRPSPNGEVDGEILLILTEAR